MDSYEFHPIADIFPLLDDASASALEKDVAANGLQQSIVLFSGRILDGRNRYIACQKAGVQPTFTEYTGTEPIKFVLSANLHRRHLSESQRGMVAGRIANLKQGQKPSSISDKPIGASEITVEDASSLLNVGKRTITRAKKVLDTAVPEVVEQVDKGTMPVSVAEEIAELPGPRQKAIADFFANGKPKEGKAAAKSAKPTKPPRPGKPVFDDRIIEDLIGKLARNFDARANAYGKCAEHTDCINQLDKVANAWKRWQKAG